MSEQPFEIAAHPVYRIVVSTSQAGRVKALLDQLPSLGIAQNIQLKISPIYFIEGRLSAEDLRRLSPLICDPVTESYRWKSLMDDGVNLISPEFSDRFLDECAHCIEVGMLPGVTDTIAGELLLACQGLGLQNVQAIASGERYEFFGELSTQEFESIASQLLANPTIQRYVLGELQPHFLHPSTEIAPPAILPIRNLDSESLQEMSQARRLALDLAEMQAVQAYYVRQGRDPTDAELETLAQTWSEHCVHKTFKALIHLHPSNLGDQVASTGSSSAPHPMKDGVLEIDGLLNSYLRAATEAIGAPWVISAFVDNAGVIEFDETYDLSFKVETHNHPSAIEPFGGANTGLGGVVRDVLGVSHRPIAATDVLCFGDLHQAHTDLPAGVLHPRRVQAGVVAGIEDYGNKLGLPTVNGTVLYHRKYTANPLVFCGCVGLGKRNIHKNQPESGDRIIVIGGRTGRDGLRGATFSSLAMDAQTGQVAGSAVQIGDPITEKGVIEVVFQASQMGLYHAITDCGAGGLSSAVGEMSAGLGACVDLAAVRLKYTGLAPWEVWLSEAQERMVLALPAEYLPELADLCRAYRVEWSDIGSFQDSGRLLVKYGDRMVLDLENDFLHHGMPRLHLHASAAAYPAIPAPPVNPTSEAEEPTAENYLLALLSHPNLHSKEAIIRLYDHEVRGMTVIKPLVGEASDGPSDAVVLKPLETQGWRGFVLANGINPTYGEYDPYAMAYSAVDEAIRNAVAVGADPQHLALLDNFCWGDPRRPETLGSLALAARGCYDAALHYRAPFISGKDSLNNEYIGTDGVRQAIPGTLLISSIAIHPDIRRAVSMDVKQAGSRVYLVGDWAPALAGSHIGLIETGWTAEFPELQHTPGFARRAPHLYQSLHQAILNGWVLSVHDLSEGGLAVAAAEMCLAGRLGMDLNLSALHAHPLIACFAETNGCLLVEVKEQDAVAFERHIQRDSGNPAFQKLGETTSDGRLKVWHAGMVFIHMAVQDLLAAFIA